MIKSLQLFKKNLFNFNGRATRPEFWYAYLWAVLYSAVVSLVLLWAQANNMWLISFALGAVGFLLGFCFMILWMRRLQDAGRSPYWILLMITGIGVIVLIVFACFASDPRTNQYGPYEKFADKTV